MKKITINQNLKNQSADEGQVIYFTMDELENLEDIVSDKVIEYFEAKKNKSSCKHR